MDKTISGTVYTKLPLSETSPSYNDPQVVQLSRSLVTTKNARQNFNKFLKLSKKIRSNQQGQCAPGEFAHPGGEAV